MDTGYRDKCTCGEGLVCYVCVCMCVCVHKAGGITDRINNRRVCSIL
jgi:hypothetical protein